MALIDVHAFSDALGMQVAFHVLLPQPVTREIGVSGSEHRARYPVLWLLHGLSDDHTTWLRRTSIERYAATRNLAIVMPAGGRSFYQDMASGANYWTFLTEELPALCRAWFPMSDAREDNFVAGLSMGGYGAIRMALAKPDRYAAGASLSGALDLNTFLREASEDGSPIKRAEWAAIFGAELRTAGTDADLYFLAERVAAGTGPTPKLFVSCGTDDPLIGDSRAFHRHLIDVGLGHTYEEHPGDHEWDYWDTHIQRVIEWLPL
jgi:Predicted esterase